MGQPLVFRGARIVDARSDAPVEADVLVVGEDGRIAGLGPASSTPMPADAREIEAAGLTLLPGLIDCHVHLALAFRPLHDEVQVSPTDLVVRALTTGRAFVEAGITSARDAGGASAGIRRAFASGDYPGPRLQVSVTALSQTGGHGDGWTLSGIDIVNPPTVDLPSGICDGVEEVRRVVRRVIRAGAEWIKVCATGGVFSATDTPDAAQFSLDELRVMVEEAEAAGIHGVMAHAEGTRGIKNAIRAGVKSIEHGDILDEEAIDLLLEHDLPIVPTFHIADEMVKPERIARGEIPPWAVEKGRILAERQVASFARAVRRGVRVVMGTDDGAGVHPPTELALMARHGLGGRGALRAATIEAARLLGMGADLGTLEPGKLADLILVDFDPLTEPERWAEPRRIVFVLQGGRVVADRRAPERVMIGAGILARPGCG